MVRFSKANWLRQFLFAAVMLLLLTACEGQSSFDKTMLVELDAKIQHLMQTEDVKGLAIALIENDSVVRVETYGMRNLEQQLPLQTDTIMYGASLTKTAFSYMVLQLADEGLIDLDQTIDAYLEKPLEEYGEWTSLANQADWRKLTPRIILTHTTGLHNLRFFEPDGQLRFHFEPGERFSYSGEGFYLLQTVVQEGLGIDVKTAMQERVFGRLGMTNTSMQWRESFAGNLADGYTIDGGFVPHDERSYVSASGSMDTTIADQALLWHAILDGEGISNNSRAEMVKPHVPINSASQFPALSDATDPRTADINLAAGLSVITYNNGQGLTWSKGGHNPWTANLVVCQEWKKRCLVMLSNSVRAELIYPQIVELVLGETGAPWWWYYPELQE